MGVYLIYHDLVKSSSKTILSIKIMRWFPYWDSKIWICTETWINMMTYCSQLITIKHWQFTAGLCIMCHLHCVPRRFISLSPTIAIEPVVNWIQHKITIEDCLITQVIWPNREERKHILHIFGFSNPSHFRLAIH